MISSSTINARRREGEVWFIIHYLPGSALIGLTPHIAFGALLACGG
jgi:hypothetical protein